MEATVSSTSECSRIAFYYSLLLLTMLLKNGYDLCDRHHAMRKLHRRTCRYVASRGVNCGYTTRSGNK